MQIQKIREVHHRFKNAVLHLARKKRKLLPVDGATVTRMAWACFDHAFFDKMFGIAFVFYSVPVYFNPAVGSLSFIIELARTSPRESGHVVIIMNSWSMYIMFIQSWRGVGLRSVNVYVNTTCNFYIIIMA